MLLLLVPEILKRLFKIYQFKSETVILCKCRKYHIPMQWSKYIRRRISKYSIFRYRLNLHDLLCFRKWWKEPKRNSKDEEEEGVPNYRLQLMNSIEAPIKTEVKDELSNSLHGKGRSHDLRDDTTEMKDESSDSTEVRDHLESDIKDEDSSDDDLPLAHRYPNPSGTINFVDVKCEIIEEDEPLYEQKTSEKRSRRKQSELMVNPKYKGGGQAGAVKLECHLCGEKYFDLKTHLEKHAKKPSYDCEVCQKSFTFKGKLLDHKKFEHGIDFACEICKKKFNTKDSIRIHMSVHATESKFICQICGFSSKRKNGLEIHMRRHEDKWVCRCSVCNKGFFSYTKLAEHMNNHTGERPFTCDQCGCSYASSNTLWSHARKMHPQLFNNLHTCEYCNKIFMKSKSLQAHMEALHSKGDHFECDVCTKTFTKETSLIFHRRTHTNERPFVCNVCGGAFTANKFLRKHRSIHSERKFKCRFCYKRFVHEKFLMSHEQKHSEVKTTY